VFAEGDAEPSEDAGERRLALGPAATRTALAGPAIGPAARAEAARRAALLEKLRSPSDAPPAAPESAALGQEIEELLRDVLDGLDAHEGRQVLEAAVERAEVETQEVAYFGAADHLQHPSLDIYQDPLKAYSDRPELHLAQVDPRDFDYPIVLNARVQNWMVYFLTRGRKWFVKWLARSERYRPLIVPLLEEAGLPQDLLFQAMIESGFNPYATSSARAVGVWQFISSTGKAYGLQRDWWIDERRDPVRATHSAIAFLTHLYKRFGSWELASAAYNAGGGKISRAIKMYGTNDFWELAASSRTYLKPETKNYVPKIIAAAILARYADRYGLTADIPQEHRLSLWDHDKVSVPEATDLAVVAKLVGIPLAELQAINPALRRGYTPPAMNNYRLNVPRGTGKAFARKFARIPARDRLTFLRYKVRRGDTLGRIAGRYKVPVAAIQKLNHIRDPRRLRVGQRILVPVRTEQMPARQLTHVVARGENLSRIAARYGTSVAGIKERNGLSSDMLKAGQRLVVFSQGSGTKDVASAQGPANSAPVESTSRPPNYTVRSGDSLSYIARRFGMSLSELQDLNELGRRGTIYPGDKLLLHKAVDAPNVISYTVKAGDTLSAIASRYGMATRDLLDRNGLSSDQIRVGQKLKVVASGQGGSPVVVQVEKGDSLYGIASRHKVSVEAIRTWNRLTNTTIRIGQRLTLYPGQSLATGRDTERAIAYQVQSGDTLWGISRKYGVSIKELKSWNGIRHDKVRPGQRLRVILR
jgi:membrane-bound lytic murein transglycosylase D